MVVGARLRILPPSDGIRAKEFEWFRFIAGQAREFSCDILPKERQVIPMLYMVIERFKNRDAKAVYRRFREKGRMAPQGLVYVESWVETNFDRCFQVMECEDARLLEEWTAQWRDLVEFEFVPVLRSKEAAEFLGPEL